MTTLPILQSYIAGRWIGQSGAAELHSAVNGRAIYQTHADAIDFAEPLDHAYGAGVRNLQALDFQQRAAILKALALWLLARKEQFYAVSAHTGATRADSWIDIEGGAGTLFAYARVGANDLPSGNVVHEGPAFALGKTGAFCGTHILVPRPGVAVHINAFNFPVWGMLEKFAPTFLAGMPSIVKPATATSYLSEAVVRAIVNSGLLPEGSLQLIIGSTGDLLDRLDSQDVVTFTGSADTALKLRTNSNLVARSIPFNAEADSLNCALLAPDIGAEDEELDLFVREVAREMTVKAGQKCTAIRRVLVPHGMLEVVVERLSARLAKTVVGDPSVDGVRMGPLASAQQQADVLANVALLARQSEIVFGAAQCTPTGVDTERGAFVSPMLLVATSAPADAAVHHVEAFGPVSTVIPYSDLDEAVQLAAHGRGSLVSTLVTRDPRAVRRVVPAMAAWHGRVHILERVAAAESTGHGSPLPQLKHGGPGRAGGGEELGGVRAVRHYLQRTAIQGSPEMLMAVTGEYVRGAPVTEEPLHPFRKWFDDVQVGDSLQTHRRTVTEADIVAFGGISGDFFYMHFDEIAAAKTSFGRRIAHGYFVLSAAAGLFVSPGEGPVLANYGLDALRFVKPVGIGDTIQARLTCKRKTDRPRKRDQAPQGVVAWDVQVTNQLGELVASYDILTLVLKRPI